MITLTREEAQQVLDALETLAKYEHPEHKIQIRKQKNGGHIVTVYPHKLATNGAEILSARLSAPEPQPVAYLCENAVGHKYFRWKKPQSIFKPIPLYIDPPQREWQGLTDEEMEAVANSVEYNPLAMTVYEYRVAVQKATSAKLREKNNG